MTPSAPPGLAYRILDSPLGPLLLVAGPAGLVRIAFDREDHDAVLARLASPVGEQGAALAPAQSPTRAASLVPAPRRLDEAARQLDAYFAGRRRRFELALDLRRVPSFHRRVLDRLPEIPYGTATSYTALAGTLGKPAAARAVGGACAANPLPIVLPCHRMLRRDGSFDRYLGGTEAKRWLLALEGAPEQVLAEQILEV